MYIIAGKFRNRRLISPKGSQTRPTAGRVRESLFNICQGYIEGARFLDLFAGSGAIGLEALSRGADSVTFVDQSREAVKCIERNIAELGVASQTHLLSGPIFPMLKLLERHRKQFDVIYVDPPYSTQVESEGEKGYYSALVIKSIDHYQLLAEGGTLFIEEDARVEPKIDNLERLKIENSRKYGHSVLQSYTTTAIRTVKKIPR